MVRRRVVVTAWLAAVAAAATVLGGCPDILGVQNLEAGSPMPCGNSIGPYGTDLIVNGTFDAGTSSWAFTDKKSATVIDGGYNTASALELCPVGALNIFGMAQFIDASFPAQTNYSGSVWARATESDAALISIGLVFDTCDAGAEAGAAFVPRQVGTDWTNLLTAKTSTNDVHGVTVSVYCSDGGACSCVIVDDVSLVANAVGP